PSRTLPSSLGKVFRMRILGVLVLRVLVLMVRDLVGNTGKIRDHPGNGQPELLRYVSLRVPQLIARFLPYSVLLATVITLATFRQNSQVIAMKAAGLSAHQSLAPPLRVAALIAAFSFTFNERSVTRATATLKVWEAADFAPVADDPTARANIYLNDGNDVLLASSISGSGPATVMRGVTFYQRDEDGMIVRQWRAPVARWANPGWLLEDPRAFAVGPAEAIAPAQPVVVAPGITLDQLEIRRVDPDGETLRELARSIDAMQAAGRRTAELEGKWWHKISG